MFWSRNVDDSAGVFSRLVVDPAFPSLSELAVRRALDSAISHLALLSSAEKRRGTGMLVSKILECTLSSDLEAMMQCILSHTFAVETLAILESGDKLLEAFTDLCHSILDRHNLQDFVRLSRAVAANRTILNKTLDCLLTMAFSKKETGWKKRRQFPAHHNHTLAHALMLLCLSKAVGERRFSPIALLESWVAESTNTLLMPSHAKTVVSYLNVERIVKVLEALDLLTNEVVGPVLHLIVRYTVLIARLQRKESYYEYVDSAARISSIAEAVSGAFERLFNSNVFVSFLEAVPIHALKEFLGAVVNEVVVSSILKNSVNLVCGIVLSLRNAGKVAMADMMASSLAKKVSAIDVARSVKQQVWESMYAHPAVDDALQTTVMAELQEARSLQLVDSLPVNVLIGICEKSTYYKASSIMARLFTNLGSSLLLAVKNNLYSPLRALDGFSAYEKLLLQHFKPQTDSMADMDRFLEPVVWIAAGVNEAAGMSRTLYSRTEINDLKDTQDAVPWCFFFILRLYLENPELSALSGDEVIPSVWRSKVIQALTKKVFDNPSMHALFQKSLATFTISGKSSFFGELSALEGGQDMQGKSLPPMYEAMSEALGGALYRSNIAKVFYGRIIRENVVTNHIEKCIEVLSKQSKYTGFCCASFAFVRANLDGLLVFLREEKYIFPKCLENLFSAFGRMDVGFMHDHDDRYLLDISSVLSEVRSHLGQIVDNIHSAEVLPSDLDTISQNIDNIKAVCRTLDIQKEKLPMLGADLLAEYQLALHNSKDLDRIILFLHQRNLCPQFSELRNALEKNTDTSVTIRYLKDTILYVISRLGLDDNSNVLRALRSFAGNSDLFMQHFAKVDTKVNMSEQGTLQEVVERTEYALKNLSLLVSNENIRIDDFFAVDIAGLVSELKRTGHGQSHRQRKMERELKAIAQFFGSETNSDGQASIERLNSAFYLVDMKQILPSFLLSMKELNLGHLFDGNTSNNLSNILKELSDNFFIRDGPSIKDRLDSALGGLRKIDLVIISKLASSEELSAGLMLQVFARFSTEVLFDQALEHAQNQSSGNPVAGKLLLKLRGLRVVLRPIWNPTCVGSLRDLAEHMLREVRVFPTQGGELICPTLEELTNVIEHWAE
eukprot:gene29116-35142_t